MQPQTSARFSRYEIFVIAILTILQFTIILDFMVLAPLGAILMPKLGISTSQFGLVVSAYAFSAGISGFLAAGFADKYDRKKLLLFFYTGFVIGTLFCGTAINYEYLLMARIVTGIFGGVIGSIGFAIVTDLFPIEVRGRVMGFLQMAFAGSQVLGLPIGLYLANKYSWHAPFLMIVGVSVIIGIVIIIYMKPVTGHLDFGFTHNPFRHLIKTLSRPTYLRAFATTTLLATGGFMMMPFGSAFSVNNLGVSLEQLPILYMITGISSMLMGPVIGRLSDSMGKYRVFLVGTIVTAIITGIYSNLSITPFWILILINIVFFTGLSSRMISSSSLISGIPEPSDRGAFMGVNSSLQQLSGGLAAMFAGVIVSEAPSGKLLHYNTLAYIVIGTMALTLILMNRLNQEVLAKSQSPAAGTQKK